MHNKLCRCGIVYVGPACLTWQQLFSAWFSAIRLEPWLENHDVILQQLFEWLLPPLLATASSCRLAAAISPLNLVQGSLHLFQVLLQEALPNLKERKYLRGWIQVSSNPSAPSPALLYTSCSCSCSCRLG